MEVDVVVFCFLVSGDGQQMRKRAGNGRNVLVVCF
jgi:hypothetical protein